jgi:formylglycine-generating enzyme required for sulfatase activity
MPATKAILVFVVCVIGAFTALAGSPGSTVAGTSADLERRLVYFTKTGLLRAFEDIHAGAPDRFPDADAIRRRIAALPDDLQPLFKAGTPAALEALTAVADLQRAILLANPILDFDLVVARETDNLGLPANFHSNSNLKKVGYNNRVMQFSIHGKTPERTLFTPEKTRFIGNFCLHFDADRMLFSMPTDQDWQVFEIRLDGTGLRQISPEIGVGVNNYDACYLPNGEFLFTSTLPMVSVPCVAGGAKVANLVRLHADGSVRQLCFDQEHNWHPRVLPNGTVLYQRWEYTDTPHANTRLLMTMNPDGTDQRSLYGSNSYWPTAFFYATPVPGSSTRVAGISTGHHGEGRLGELIILDAAKGRYEATGVIRAIPSTATNNIGRVYDHMRNVWPRFLNPQPLSENYLLVSCQPTPKHKWGVYLVDVFDNFLLIKDNPALAIVEPVPVVRRPVPPVLPDTVQPSRKDATIYIADIYEGPGLRGIPRGAVKSIRAFSYTFSYHGVGGLLGVIGLDGPWDLHRPLGTAKVHADGSAKFTIPANTPISLQPLDADGQALAVMRSWLTAMPGEVLSCVGCHEDRNMAPPARRTIASTSADSPLDPWRPYVAGFSFDHEVQPVLDRRCIACHDGVVVKPDLRKGAMINYHPRYGGARGGKASQAYINLYSYSRAYGIESDYHLQSPMEFHFSTSELGQMLIKGHHGVKLDPAERDALVVWSDLNRPYHGSWRSIGWEKADIPALEGQRSHLREQYSGVSENHEEVPPLPAPVQPVKPLPLPPIDNPPVALAGWPFAPDASPAAPLEVDGYTIEMMKIPAGEFVMGNPDGHRDEQPVSRVVIAKPFQMAKHEVSNELYRKFNPTHDSKVADMLSYQFGQRFWSLNEAHQPVCRVSFRDALAFCEWLSGRTGRTVTLPTEAQWEWAARAGTATPAPFTDYSRHANTADLKMQRFYAETAHQNYSGIAIKTNPSLYEMYFLHDPLIDDGQQLSAKPGAYPANAFGLHDMHGNVAEWTRSRYLAYPYGDADVRNDDSLPGKRVARGGSWWHRPKHCTSSHRFVYDDYQPVMWVGFRVVISE